MEYEERRKEAQEIYLAGLKRVEEIKKSGVKNPLQKFQIGDKIKITSKIGSSQFYDKYTGFIEYSYSQAFPAHCTDNWNEYSINIDNQGSVAWFSVEDLELVNEEETK